MLPVNRNVPFSFLFSFVGSLHYNVSSTFKSNAKHKCIYYFSDAFNEGQMFDSWWLHLRNHRINSCI